MATSSNAEELIQELYKILERAPSDTKERQKLYDEAQNLVWKLEGPLDTMQRICYLPLQLSVTKLAVDLGLFELLVKNQSPLDLHQIQEKTGADMILLRRILRYLASISMIEEVATDTYKTSNMTETMTRPAFVAGIRHNFDLVTPCFQQLPAFLYDTKYRNPSDGANSPYQVAFNTKEPIFLHMPKNPYFLEDFNRWMTVKRDGARTWVDKFDFQQECCGEISLHRPILVDVGGGLGHQCQLLKEHYPDLHGRVILQDQSPVLTQAPDIPGVEKMTHDFWQPQPVKGANAYYMRNILHDYPNEKCIRLLRQTLSAMGKNSVIIIDEMVLPTTGAPWRATQIDFLMMSCLAAVERTGKEWQDLLNAAGLKISRIVEYDEQRQDSVIIAVPNDEMP